MAEGGLTIVGIDGAITGVVVTTGVGVVIVPVPTVDGFVVELDDPVVPLEGAVVAGADGCAGAEAEVELELMLEPSDLDEEKPPPPEQF